MDRQKFNKLWLLFAVFATGLVWTWSQVGQRSQQAFEVDGRPVDLLRVEAGCHLAAGPCAAYGDNAALVASVTRQAEGLRWRVKALGEALPALPELALELREPGGAPLSLQVVKVGDEWQAYSSGLAPADGELRVRLSGGERPWVADFPLDAAQ